jgi:hypothetical protein
MRCQQLIPTRFALSLSFSHFFPIAKPRLQTARKKEEEEEEEDEEKKPKRT